MKYIIVGANPFRMANNTLTFTSLSVVGNAKTKEEAYQVYEDNYDRCGGLLLVIDITTGLAADLD
ncbi:MAG: hypothetical protein ACWGQW_18055 [bacterium]